MPKAHPAVQRACEYLLRGIQGGLWQSSGKLPSLANLARACGVSRDSMHKAVVRLKKEGILSVIERGGIHLGGFTATQAVVQPTLLWQRQRIRIERDINAGVYPPGSRLPSSGELQSRYQVSFRTLRKILEALNRDGMLEHKNRSYVVAQPERKSHQSRVLFICGDRPAIEDASPMNQRLVRFIDTVERECARQKISLGMMYVDWKNDDPGQIAQRIASYHEPLLGFIFNVHWYENLHPEKFNLLLRAAARMRLPVAVVDQVGEYRLPHEFHINPRVRMYRIPAASAGAALARHLLALNHTRIAYISNVHQYLWSQQRLAGVQQRYADAGFAGAVEPFVSMQAGGYFSRIFAMSGLDKKTFGGIVSGHPFEPIFRAVLDGDDPVWPEEVFAGAPRRLVDEIHADFSHLARHFAGGGVSSHAFSLARDAVFTSSFQRLETAELTILFDRASACPDISAWILGSDTMAITALRYLQSKKICVPQHLSIASFDNLPLSLEHRLTTYDFNMSQAIHVLTFLTEHLHDTGVVKQALVEVPGLLIVRESTAMHTPA